MIKLETKRLYLREFHIEDGEFFFELNKDPEVVKYTGDKAFESTEEAREFIYNYKHYEKFGYGRWLVIEKESGNKIGFCGLKNNGNYIDLGYRFIKSAWGKGYATEAAHAVLQAGFQRPQLEEVFVYAHPENTASLRVIKKLDFQYIDDKYDKVSKENLPIYRMKRSDYSDKKRLDLGSSPG